MPARHVEREFWRLIAQGKRTERLHSALDYRPLVEFEDHHYRDTTTPADLAVA